MRSQRCMSQPDAASQLQPPTSPLLDRILVTCNEPSGNGYGTGTNALDGDYPSKPRLIRRPSLMHPVAVKHDFNLPASPIIPPRLRPDQTAMSVTWTSSIFQGLLNKEHSVEPSITDRPLQVLPNLAPDNRSFTSMQITHASIFERRRRLIKDIVTY